MCRPPATERGANPSARLRPAKHPRRADAVIRRLITGACAALAIAVASGATPYPLAPVAVEVAPGVYVFRGLAGETGTENLGRTANVSAITGPNGVAVIESGVSWREGEAIIAAVRRITPRPIRLLILTHAAQEVVFGAAAFQARGIPVLMHRDAAALMAARCDQCLQRLNQALGAEEMARTSLIKPDLLIDRSTSTDVIGRSLRIIVPGRGAHPARSRSSTWRRAR